MEERVKEGAMASKPTCTIVGGGDMKMDKIKVSPQGFLLFYAEEGQRSKHT